MSSSKRLHLTLFAVSWAFCAHAAGWLPLAKPFTATCSQSSTFLARTSGLSVTERNAYDTMICGMVTDGTWSLLDGLYIFATHNTTTAGLNLVSTNYTVTVHGTMTFSADHGWTGNGTTGYLDTGFTPSTATSPNYAQNSAEVGVYVTNSRTVTHDYVEIGTGTSGTYTAIDPLDTVTGYNWLVNATNDNIYTPANARGSWLASRTSSTATVYYGNGSSVASNSSDTTGLPALPTHSLAVFAENDGGSIDQFSADSLSAAWWGGGLNSTQAAAVQSRINAYMTALGINVY